MTEQEKNRLLDIFTQRPFQVGDKVKTDELCVKNHGAVIESINNGIAQINCGAQIRYWQNVNTLELV